ncbi:unnamed protein product [Mucor hiemalis]
MCISVSFDQSVTAPLAAAVTLATLLEEINVLWGNIYDICETEVKALTITGHQLHVDFLNYMALVGSECTAGCNSLENIHTELLIAVENGSLVNANGREILSDATRLLEVFSTLFEQSKNIKHRVDDSSLDIERHRKGISKNSLVEKASAQVNTSTRIRTTLFSSLIGFAASDFLDSIDSKIIMGLSAAAITTVGISSVIDVFQSEKFKKIRLIVDALKERIGLLSQYVDEFGADISMVVDDLKAYVENTEDCVTRPENSVSERFQAKGKSLIKNTLALNNRLKQVRARAVANSTSIRKIIRLERASGISGVENSSI